MTICPSRHHTTKCRMTFPVAILMHNFTYLVRNRRLEELGGITHPKVILQRHRKVIPPAKAIDCGKERRWRNKKPHFKRVAANKLPAHCSIVFTITAELRTKKNPDICVQSFEFMLLVEGYVLSLNALLKKNTYISLMQHFHRWYCFPAVSCLQTKPYAAIQLKIHRSFFWLWAMERRFKGVLCWPGSTIARLQRRGGNPASHPQENQTHTDCFHSKEKKRNFTTPFSP